MLQWLTFVRNKVMSWMDSIHLTAYRHARIMDAVEELRKEMGEIKTAVAELPRQEPVKEIPAVRVIIEGPTEEAPAEVVAIARRKRK